MDGRDGGGETRDCGQLPICDLELVQAQRLVLVSGENICVNERWMSLQRRVRFAEVPVRPSILNFHPGGLV